MFTFWEAALAITISPVMKQAYSPRVPLRLSQEQRDIIYCTAPVVVAQAFAGTGKSATGVGYAQTYPTKKILVLSFNRENASEARLRYPPNVSIATTHGLAIKCLSEKMKQRVVNRWGPLAVQSDLDQIGLRCDMRTAAVVRSILHEFFISDDDEIDPTLHGQTAKKSLSASDRTIEAAIPAAKTLWFAMNSENGINGSVTNTVAIPHDAYLKRFCQSSENLGFDTVIFDEAQDANPITLRLLQNQYESKGPSGTNTRVIYLGDRHQAIYEFRGAVNAMERLPSGAVILPLTQSWRFGKRVADTANLILSELKGEGLSIMGMGSDEGHRKGPLALLARTNAELLQRAAARNGQGVHWIGGVENYQINVLNDVLALRNGRLSDIQDVFIKRHFQSWHQLEDAASVDPTLETLKKLYETYADTIPKLLASILNNAVANPTDAELILTPAHKAKGLEWDHVAIADDYKDVFTQAEAWLSGSQRSFPEQEVNLMYVAVTRAKKSLTENTQLQEWGNDLEVHRAHRIRQYDPTYKEVEIKQLHHPGKIHARGNPFGNIASVPGRRKIS